VVKLMCDAVADATILHSSVVYWRTSTKWIYLLLHFIEMHLLLYKECIAFPVKPQNNGYFYINYLNLYSCIACIAVAVYHSLAKW